MKSKINILIISLLLFVSLNLFAKTPKYVFLFIGDGMSYPQIQLTGSYLSALEQEEMKEEFVQGAKDLNFMNFPIIGTVTTHDSTSFAPDSASTATSLATGKKTHSGVISMDETKRIAYPTIAERLKKEKGYKIGIVSSVNLNHATPAAFYAHQPSRSHTYEIGEDLINSNFDYFAGGGLLKAGTGAKNLYSMAAAKGYKVEFDHDKMEDTANGKGKVMLVDNEDAMPYEIDRADDATSLEDYVEMGIEHLYNDGKDSNGFFMMIESGKIDWACHANDAASSIFETLALADAIEEALDFYEEHPTETLIIVTGDHETGGLSIGFAGTKYDTFLTLLENQELSYEAYDHQYVEGYIKNKTSFNTAMKDVLDVFGLALPLHAIKAEDKDLILTAYEVQRLKEAYARTLKGNVNEANAKDYVAYGGYTPFTITITHILNNKSGINFSSYSHTGLPVPVYAKGIGAENFIGYYDNTDINKKLNQLLGL